LLGIRPTINWGFRAAHLRHISLMRNVGLNENRPVWGEAREDDAARENMPSLPRLTTTIDADVCVIGLGGSGLACIDELLQAGTQAKRVVGLDRSEERRVGKEGGYEWGGEGLRE